MLAEALLQSPDPFGTASTKVYTAVHMINVEQPTRGNPSPLLGTCWWQKVKRKERRKKRKERKEGD